MNSYSYFNSLTDEIKARISILSLFQKLYPGCKLDNRGRRIWAICPFHNEKTASFVLYSDTNTFHCFGCREGGSVIDLYALTYRISPNEAIHRLAEELGLFGNISLEDRIKTKQAVREREARAGLNNVAAALITEERCWLCRIYRTASEALLKWVPTNENDLDNPGFKWAQSAACRYERLLDYFDSLSPEEQRSFAIRLRKERLGDE